MLNEDMGERSTEDRSAQAGENGECGRRAVQLQPIRRVNVNDIEWLSLRLKQLQEPFRTKVESTPKSQNPL